MGKPKTRRVVPKKLNAYHKTLSRRRQPLPCPDCEEPILPSKFEGHCSEQHGVNALTTCVWCRRLTWSLGQKNQNADHLLQCYRTYVHWSHKEPFVRNDQAGLMNGTPVFPQRTLFGGLSLPTAEEHDTLHPLQGATPSLEFREDNLTLAASYVTRYLQTRETHDWLHVMVRAVVFDRFVKALDEDAGETRTLAFSCWCNGGKYPEAQHRQHRHLVVVARRNHFQTQVWPKVEMAKEEPKPKNFQCKKWKRVESALHLVNLIGYVSHRGSRCQFTFKEKKTTPLKRHHFYLYRNVPKMYRLPLVLLWDNGFQELLIREKTQNLSILEVVKHPMMRVEDRWSQKIGDFYGYESGLVVPVSKKFLPVDREDTPHYLCLSGGKKLFFESYAGNESLDDETWLNKQIAGGNCFYDIVKEELWFPRQEDQNSLAYHMPAVLKIQELTSQLHCLESEMQKKIDQAYEENNRSYQENKRLSEENKQLREEKLRLYEDNKKLHEENKKLREEENARLMFQLNAKDEDNARLKEEITRLKEENARLKLEKKLKRKKL